MQRNRYHLGGWSSWNGEIKQVEKGIQIPLDSDRRFQQKRIGQIHEGQTRGNNIWLGCLTTYSNPVRGQSWNKWNKNGRKLYSIENEEQFGR